MAAASLILIPTVLQEGQTDCLPAYITAAIRQCNVFFVENERTARRFVKLLWRDMVIDDYQWHNMKEITPEVHAAFTEAVRLGKTIGVLSEAGCPGIADPGQQLAAWAQELKVPVKPLVGPSSIILALMASGMNGQHFRFAGYLPIEAADRQQTIKSLEAESKQKGCTQIFIETPYRNNQLLEALVKTCHPQTRICVAADLTGPAETVVTKTAAQWKGALPSLHKRPAIFLLHAGG